MKRKIGTIILCIVCMGCLLIADASAEPPSYPMVCKGGGNMGAELRTSAKFIAITFEKSPQAASRQEPAPGTCAWVDRPLSPQEPVMLGLAFQKPPDNFIIRKENITVLFDDQSFQDRNLKYLVDAIYNGRLFYVRCYNDANHICRITQIGP